MTDKIACFRSLHQKLQIKEIDFGVVDVTWYFAGEHFLIIQSTDFENEMQIKRMLLIDEVYVKLSFTYHAGSVFGKAKTEQASLASTVLSFMLVSLYGGPQYLCRSLPVCVLNSKFLFEQTQFVP